MEENKKQYLNKIFQQRLHENINLPHLQQYEHVYKQNTIKEVKYKKTKKRVVSLELGLCPNCDSKTYCVDYIHGERVCPQCGYVFDEFVFEKPRYLSAMNIERGQLSYQDKQYLKLKNYKFVTEAQAWKKRQIQREIDVLTSYIELNKSNKQIVEEIIEKVGLKKLHSRASSTTIICAVIRYVLKSQSCKNLVSLRYDRSIFKENLSAKEYIIVEKNIIKHYGDLHVNPPKTKKKKIKKRQRKNKKYSKNKCK